MTRISKVKAGRRKSIRGAKKRQFAKRKPAGRLKFEKLLTDISLRFISLPADRIDDEIMAVQESVCKLLSIDICALWQFSPNAPDSLKTTHVYTTPDFPIPVPEKLDAQQTFPWCLKTIRNKQNVIVSRMQDVPAEAAIDLGTFKHFRVRSSLIFPLFAGDGNVFGALSWDTWKKEQEWTEELVNRLLIVSQVLANALSRKFTDEKLKESEINYRSIFNGAVEGMFRTTPQGKFIMANGALARMLGYDSAQEIIRVVDHVGNDVWLDPHERAQYLRQLESQEIIPGYECTFKRKDGSAISVSLRARIVRGPGGRVVCYDGFVEDITERKRAETALSASETRFRVLAESALVGIYILQDGKYIYVNPAMAAIFGYSVSEMVGMEPRQIVQPSDHGMVDENIRRRISGQTLSLQYEVNGRHRDGSTRNVEVYGTRLEMNGRPALVGTLIDVTKRKEAEQTLAESEKRYRMLFESAPEGVLLIGPDGYVKAANLHQAQMYGYDSAQKLEGMYAPLFVAPQDRQKAAQNMKSILDGNELVPRDYTAVRRDGTEFLVEVTSVILRGPRQDVQGYLCITRDITKSKQDENDRAQLRNELAHLSRIAVINELSASLAHEINQPLGAILNNASAAKILAAKHADRPDDVDEILSDIVEDAKRAGEVIRKIKGLIKKGDSRKEKVNINEIIQDVLSIFQNTFALNGISCILDLSPRLLEAEGDRVRLQQVLANLINNAMDAMRESPARALKIRSELKDPGTVLVSVLDSGKGIGDGKKDVIFQSFYTTKKNGLGLGLPICKSIVEDHGGRIWAENNAEGGATFRVALAAAKTEAL